MHPFELSDIGWGGQKLGSFASAYPRGSHAQNFFFLAEKGRFLPSVMANCYRSKFEFFPSAMEKGLLGEETSIWRYKLRYFFELKNQTLVFIAHFVNL